MVTSDERREVAERLRGEEIARNSEDAYVVLLSCIGIRPQLPAVRTYKDAMARMADLIDPTCHMTDSRWDNGECTWGCICSACGARIEHEYASDIDYCPRCGARVVNDDGRR